MYSIILFSSLLSRPFSCVRHGGIDDWRDGIRHRRPSRARVLLVKEAEHVLAHGVEIVQAGVHALGGGMAGVALDAEMDLVLGGMRSAVAAKGDTRAI